MTDGEITQTLVLSVEGSRDERLDLVKRIKSDIAELGARGLVLLLGENIHVTATKNALASIFEKAKN